MRRLLSVCLICLLCVSFFGCSDDSASKVHVPVKFYYRNIDIGYNSEHGVISAEIREAGVHQEDYEYLVKLYLQGPTGDLHHDTFPSGTSLQQLTVEDGTVKIVLDKTFSSLSGHELSIACAALVRTLQEMTAATTVSISVSEGKLGNSETLVFGRDDLLYVDNNYSSAGDS